MSEKNLTGIDAKTYDKIANRISLPHTQETVDRQISDAWQNIETELHKEGHTAKLTAPDGLIHFSPIPYKGFTITLFGQIIYMNQFDIYGKLMTIGHAKKKISIQGREVEITFSIEDAFPRGIEDTMNAEKYLIGLVEQFYKGQNK